MLKSTLSISKFSTTLRFSIFFSRVFNNSLTLICFDGAEFDIKTNYWFSTRFRIWSVSFSELIMVDVAMSLAI